MPYRLIYIGLGAVVVAVIALTVAFGGGPEPVPLPEVIEELSPRPGDVVLKQTILEIDLARGYKATVSVNGFQIPFAEFVGSAAVEATGIYRWAPSPASAVFQEWTPGTYNIKVEWDSISGLPDVGSYEYDFEVQ